MNVIIPRVGHGFDVHGFEDGNALILGGVKVPHHKKFRAHSDGDVLIHALIDALLGAAGLGDIGQHFPDTDEQYKGVDSRELLQKVNNILLEQSYQISNFDITVIAQKPRLAEFLSAMKANLADDLDIEQGAINIKATTTEGLGYTGREEGIAVHAVTLIYARS